MRKITKIVVHCSATKEGRDFSAADIDRWHKERNFKEIGYHYVVRLNGTVECGRNEYNAGAHVRGHNHDSIAICYIGGIDENGNAKDTRTWQQKLALIKKIKDLKLRYPEARVYGHRDLSPDRNGDGRVTADEWLKDCPCFDAQKEYESL